MQIILRANIESAFVVILQCAKAINNRTVLKFIWSQYKSQPKLEKNCRARNEKYEKKCFSNKIKYSLQSLRTKKIVYEITSKADLLRCARMHYSAPLLPKAPSGSGTEKESLWIVHFSARMEKRFSPFIASLSINCKTAKLHQNCFLIEK